MSHKSPAMPTMMVQDRTAPPTGTKLEAFSEAAKAVFWSLHDSKSKQEGFWRGNLKDLGMNEAGFGFIYQ